VQGEGWGQMKTRALTGFARALRNRQTKEEKILWSLLRARQLSGYKFRRQLPMGPYIVDFCCLERRLVIELDGGQHALSTQRDQRRTQFLNEEGFQVLRFWNNDVLEHTRAVLEVIDRCLTGPLTPTLSPVGERETSEKDVEL